MRAAADLAVIEEIAEDVAAPAADDVDAAARFPVEAVGALRDAGLLGVTFPDAATNTPAWPLTQVVRATTALAKACSTTGLVWAMHHSQVMTLAAHAPHEEAWAAEWARAREARALFGSVASEAGLGGQLLASAAPMKLRAGRLTVVKDSSAISYVNHLDAFLISGIAPSDNSADKLGLAFAWRSESAIEVNGAWDALGMRGTETLPARLAIEVPAFRLLPTPFEVVFQQTMAPVAHILWGAVWVGIAEAAVDRATACAGRRLAGSPAAAVELSEAVGNIETARTLVSSAATAFESGGASRDPEGLPARMRRYNELKITVAQRTTAATLSALRVAGLAGYVERSASSVARHVRDILSSEVMVSNLRLRDSTAAFDALRGRHAR